MIVGGLGDEAGLECGERSREKDKNSIKKQSNSQKWSKMGVKLYWGSR